MCELDLEYFFVFVFMIMSMTKYVITAISFVVLSTNAIRTYSEKVENQWENRKNSNSEKRFKLIEAPGSVRFVRFLVFSCLSSDSLFAICNRLCNFFQIFTWFLPEKYLFRRNFLFRVLLEMFIGRDPYKLWSMHLSWRVKHHVHSFTHRSCTRYRKRT